MNLGQIEDGFFVSPQLMPGHVALLAEQGVKAIINNRPDTERGFFPADREMAELAIEHGLDYHYMPIDHSGLSMEQITAFAGALAQAGGPVVAYCASGHRSAVMWALAKASSKSVDEIIASCAAQGYNLAQMRPTLMQLSQAA